MPYLWLLLLVISLTICPSISMGTPFLYGELQSSLYTYEEVEGTGRSILNHYVGLKINPPLWRGWSFYTSGEIGEGGAGRCEKDRVRLLNCFADGVVGSLRLRTGRFVPQRTGDIGRTTDGVELQYRIKNFPLGQVSLSGGREIYTLYRGETSAIPERYRGTGTLEGTLGKGLRWQIDHTQTYRDQAIDEQVSRVVLRCRRFSKGGLDFNASYDHRSDHLRSLLIGVNVQPDPKRRLTIRYFSRQMRLFEASPLRKFEYPPVKMVSLNLRRDIKWHNLGFNIGYARRLNREREISRFLLSVDSPTSQIGCRYQIGNDMDNLGGWANACFPLNDQFTVSASVDFDRYNSLWDEEKVDNWVNSIGIEWKFEPDVSILGRLEHYRDESTSFDLRAFISVKMGFAL